MRGERKRKEENEERRRKDRRQKINIEHHSLMELSPS
jgi:hypothetical protein